MKRLFVVIALMYVITFTGGSFGQVSTKESKVKIRGKDKIEDVSGVITEESIEGITLKTGGGVKKIAALDIIDIEYAPPSFEVSKALRKASNEEGKRKYDAAIKFYQDVKATDAKLKRHLEFKVAALTARLADSDPDKVKPAIDLLTKFMANHPDSWQISQFPKVLVPLQLKAKDLEGAEQTLTKLASSKVPDNLRQECQLMSVKILMEAKKYSEAEKKFQDLIKSTSDETLSARMRVSQAECMSFNKKLPDAKKELKAIIAKTTNPELKALAFNALGECCLRANETREAMWNFLYVDVLFNQNKDEHERAIKNLIVVFKELKDDQKAAQYSNLLKKDK